MPIAESVRLGQDVRNFHPTLVNVYGCTVGEGVAIEDEVFVGHGVMFTNDRFPRATNPDGSPQSEADWSVEPTIVRRTASIGSNASTVSGNTIGVSALVAAGAWSPGRCPTTRSKLNGTEVSASGNWPNEDA